MYVCLLKHTYIHACLEVSDIHTYMLKQASRSSVCMYVCMYVWDSKLWSGGWVRFLTKNLQYLNDNSIFLRFVRGGTSGGSRQTYIHTCLATWDIHTYMLSYLRHTYIHTCLEVSDIHTCLNRPPEAQYALTGRGFSNKCTLAPLIFESMHSWHP